MKSETPDGFWRDGIPFMLVKSNLYFVFRMTPWATPAACSDSSQSKWLLKFKFLQWKHSVFLPRSWWGRASKLWATWSPSRISRSSPSSEPMFASFVGCLRGLIIHFPVFFRCGKEFTANGLRFRWCSSSMTWGPRKLLTPFQGVREIRTIFRRILRCYLHFRSLISTQWGVPEATRPAEHRSRFQDRLSSMKPDIKEICKNVKQRHLSH